MRSAHSSNELENRSSKLEVLTSEFLIIIRSPVITEHSKETSCEYYQTDTNSVAMSHACVLQSTSATEESLMALNYNSDYNLNWARRS